VITIVGGVYLERIAHDGWQEYFGSAGRAAEAIAELGSSAELYTYLDEKAALSLANRNRRQRYKVHAQDVEAVAGFDYIHGLARPSIAMPKGNHPAIKVKADKAVVYGMLGGSACVTAEYAVYDPQNTANPRPFAESGSTAKHLAVVLNRQEAERMLGESAPRSLVEIVRAVAEQEKAEVVVMKAGPIGALVYHNNEPQFVPSFRSASVFKIGSGDVFVAAFAQGWLEEGLTPYEAAERASRATAFYVQERRPPSATELSGYHPEEVRLGPRTKAHADQGGERAKVYLAGPFFTLGQLWVVEEAMRALQGMDVEVLSPYHLVGLGPADEVVALDLEYLDKSDLVLAIGDGMDAGTVFECGYANAKDKPIVFYAENEVGEDRKMFEGAKCVMVNDFTTAVYKTIWEALAL